jgi:adenylate cyclase
VDPVTRSLKQLPARLRAAWTRGWHDRRVYLRLQFGSALGLGIGLVLAVALISDVFGASSARLADLLYQAQPASRQVILIAIDDASMQEIGPWPWSRATLAALLDALTAASPRVIGFDLIFPEPTREDDVLARALERAPTVIQPVIGVEATRHPFAPNAFPRFDFVLAPAPTLRTTNTHLAHSMITPDADGIVRHIPTAIESQSQQYPTLGIAALDAFQGRQARLRLEPQAVVWNDQRISSDAQGQIKIVFVNPATQPTLSAAAVLRGRANLAVLRDKIVLVGIVSATMAQHFATPITPTQRITSVELHANVIETLLSRRWLAPQDRLIEIVMIFLVAILAGATVPHFRLLSAFALTIIYFLLYLGYAFAQFNRGILVQPLYPLIALVLVFLGAMTFRYFSQERRRATLVQLFRRYVAPETVEQVTRDFDQGAAPLGGMRRTVSVLCLDLRDLTHLTDTESPAMVFQLLNEYVTLIVGVIFRHNGTITQHSGEEIVAVWNLLLEQPQHAHAALHAAIEIRQELAAFDATRAPAAPLDVGIGVTTGPVLAGRLGTAARAEYTIIGEIVSVAERLAVKPERGIFIDAATRARIGDEFEIREVKSIKLRRQTDPHRIWQVILPLESPEETEQEETLNPEI